MLEKDFKWGCATAATQIEGAYKEDGKVLSNWDDRCNRKLIKHNHNCFVACDSYHKYKEDIKLLKKLGANAYRFSIAWPRIIKDKKGTVNPKGLAFYHRVIDECLKNGIEPFITLYHWDMPLFLSKKGGWLNKDTIEYFAYYVDAVVKEYSSKVKRFITINEIQCVTDGLGVDSTLNPISVPIKKYKSAKEYLQVIHNILIAHGRAVKIIHKYNALAGFAPCSNPPIPYSNKKIDIEAARMAYFDVIKDDLYASISVYSDPIFFGDYPKKYYEVYSKKDRPNITKRDLTIIHQPLDFYCQNIYNGSVVKSDGKGGYIKLKDSKIDIKGVLPWNLYTPKCLYWGIRFLNERYHCPLYISENGIGLNDKINKQYKIDDKDRSKFIKGYLHELKKAVDDGYPVYGYFHWSLIDNFEWFQGFYPRFGIVYVDYKTLKRYPKNSFFIYKKIIKENGKNL